MKKIITLLLASIATFSLAHAADPRPFQPVEIHFHGFANKPAKAFAKKYNRVENEIFSLGFERFETGCRMENPTFHSYGKDIIVIASLACDKDEVTLGDLQALAADVRTTLSIDLRIPLPPPGGGASSHN